MTSLNMKAKRIQYYTDLCIQSLSAGNTLPLALVYILQQVLAPKSWPLVYYDPLTYLSCRADTTVTKTEYCVVVNIYLQNYMFPVSNLVNAP